MTERENFFRIINRQDPALIPCFYDAYALCGTSLLNRWASAAGICMASTGWFPPTPATRQSPTPRSISWRRSLTGGISSDSRIWMPWTGRLPRRGIWRMWIARTRSYAFSPWKTITDFKIRSIEKVARYYKPDIFVNGDGVASSDGPFFSPSLYDELIKPYEKRIAQAAQTMNDLNGIKAKYGDKLLIHGGWDSIGPHNFDDATEEMVRTEALRCINAYGTDGNYMLFPIIIGDPAYGIMQRKSAWASDEYRRYSLKSIIKPRIYR